MAFNSWICTGFSHLGLRIAALAVGLAAFGAIGTAAAMPTCEGSYAATLIKPLPMPMVVNLDIRDDSPANRRMADRFVAGLREAGVAVGAPPNVVLQISSTRRNANADRYDGGPESSFADMSGIQGGLQFDVPSVSGRPLSQRSGPQLLLTLRVEATAGQTMQIAWVASVQCRVVGPDDGQRAQDIGRAIGAVLGQRVEPRRL